VIAAKAVCFKEALSPEFATYAQQVVDNAQALSESLVSNGVPIVSGGTDNHLMMCDLRNLGITGKEAQNILEEVHITANKNTVPDDPQSPFVTSGLRLGTPALTSRGFTPEAMREVGRIIAQTMLKQGDMAALAKQSLALAQQFPLYPELSSKEAVTHR
jgi:glycine hydroxymethyltransferase